MEMDEWKMEKVKMVEAGVSGSTWAELSLRNINESVNIPLHYRISHRNGGMLRRRTACECDKPSKCRIGGGWMPWTNLVLKTR